METLLRDRPQMRGCISSNKDIYNWSVRNFAGEAAAQRIYWDKADPNCSSCLAEINFSSSDSNKSIRIRQFFNSGVKKGATLSCENLWSALVFEFHNMSNYKLFIGDDEEALSGVISKREWIDRSTKREFKSVLKSREFYRKTWLPYARSQGYSSNPSYWHMGKSDDYNEWISSFTDPSGYPFTYGKQFDEDIAPYVRK
ncbi:MAG: hypothetical protein EOP09_02115 [Proteobacteria bacterium]|nr:MAG: hypothetical protein EOP09_02115 [Pseudomonadota bacterium]